MTSYERRLEIIRILRAKKFETMKNFAFEFGVTDRTIRNDITILTAEYPIETFRGRGGGVKLRDGRYQNILSKEQKQVLTALIEFADDHEAAVLIDLINTYGSKKRE